MISIAIPTYNYNVYPLVREMNKQAAKTGIDYEILVYDDGSTEDYNLSGLLQDFKHVKYKKNIQNIGRIANRRQMAKEARYPLLLFMDADVFPADRFFMRKIIQTLKQPADIHFGGIEVSSQCADPQKILRWKYGKYRENKSLSERKKNIYSSIISGSLLIKKNVFLNDTENFKHLNKYGLDSIFAYNLKKNKRKITHYKNPVIHLGLEKNDEFLNKTKKALETYHFLVRNYHLTDLNKITLKSRQFQKIIPKPVIRNIFKFIEPLLKKNLISQQPYLFFFDLYKLLYFSQLK